MFHPVAWILIHAKRNSQQKNLGGNNLMYSAHTCTSIVIRAQFIKYNNKDSENSNAGNESSGCATPDEEVCHHKMKSRKKRTAHIKHHAMCCVCMYMNSILLYT